MSCVREGKLCVDKLCEDKMCEDKWCVSKLCEDKLCVSKLCLNKLCVRCVKTSCAKLCVEGVEADDGRTGGRYRTKNKNPTHKDVGKNHQAHFQTSANS